MAGCEPQVWTTGLAILAVENSPLTWAAGGEGINLRTALL
jgi:hypothetical protein